MTQNNGILRPSPHLFFPLHLFYYQNLVDCPVYFGPPFIRHMRVRTRKFGRKWQRIENNLLSPSIAHAVRR